MVQEIFWADDFCCARPLVWLLVVFLAEDFSHGFPHSEIVVQLDECFVGCDILGQ